MATFISPTLEQGSVLNNIIYNLATDGDTVILPTGNVTWGAGGTPYYLTGAITLVGQGTGSIIHIADDGPAFNDGIINLWAPVTVSGLTIIGNNNTVGRTALAPGPYNGRGDGWRITNVIFSGGSQEAYFCAAQTNGVIDHCAITGGNQTSELVFARGASDAWTTASTLGTTGAVYIEDCIFGGQGYVCDANANAKMVVRYNTIVGNMKIDAHGFASNSPASSYRHIEVYNNTWTSVGAGNWANIELRGGSAMVFNNTSQTGWMFLTDYAYQAQWSNFGYLYYTQFNYPIYQQFGEGSGNAAASQPGYLWGNTQGGGPWPRSYETPQTFTFSTDNAGYAQGATGIRVQSFFTTINSGNAVAIVGHTGRYKVFTTLSNAQSTGMLIIEPPGLYQSIPASNTTMTGGAIVQYQYQTTGNGTFAESGVIRYNRDFFASTGFDTSSGVSVGSAAQMAAFTPSLTGHGFWVTGAGTWNKTYPSQNGQLYKWDGAAWNLYYTPYQYPFFYMDVSGNIATYHRLGRRPKFKGLAF